MTAMTRDVGDFSLVSLDQILRQIFQSRGTGTKRVKGRASGADEGVGLAQRFRYSEEGRVGRFL
jgi:hypothetical protein